MAADQGMPTGEEQKLREEDEDRGGLIGWLYRRYKSYDSWAGRYDWFNWLISLFKTHTAASVVATGTAAVAVGGAVVMIDPDLRERWVPKSWVEASQGEQTVETRNWGTSVVFPVDGRDLEERRAAFDVAVLPQDLTWAHRSTSVLSQGGTMIAENEVPDRVFTAELRSGLARSGEVMAVGLASQEGRRADEVERARQRATTAAGWLASVVGEQKPVWILNLGQYLSTCETAGGVNGTAWQRPLIVVGIREQEQGVRIDEAFANAISDKTNLPSKGCYTNFDLTRLR
jgi:hypothetical protein